MDAGIYYKTSMKDMPSNCLECKMYYCNLPDKKNYKGNIKKKYRIEKHENCPLLEVK